MNRLVVSEKNWNEEMMKAIREGIAWVMNQVLMKEVRWPKLESRSRSTLQLLVFTSEIKHFPLVSIEAINSPAWSISKLVITFSIDIAIVTLKAKECELLLVALYWGNHSDFLQSLSTESTVFEGFVLMQNRWYAVFPPAHIAPRRFLLELYAKSPTPVTK